MFSYYLSLFTWKILFAISGNHEAWTKALAGIDVMQHLMEQRAIVYCKDGLKITLRVGTQQYRIYLRHKTPYNSTMNPTHTIKRLYDYGDWQFDVGVRGDQHQAHLENFERHGQRRWGVRIGSYQVFSDYAESIGFPKSAPLCPVVIFYPDRRRMDAFDNLWDGAEALTAIREKYERDRAKLTKAQRPKQLTAGKNRKR
jgi:hypothetical protein